MIAALVGGALVGLAATMLVLSHGKVAGAGGIFGRTLASEPGTAHGPWFLLGLVLAGALASLLHPTSIGRFPSIPIALAAGLLVGFGVKLGNGCTSGHGVCGISRFRIRSIAATLVFMTAGIATVFVAEHVL